MNARDEQQPTAHRSDNRIISSLPRDGSQAAIRPPDGDSCHSANTAHITQPAAHRRVLTTACLLIVLCVLPVVGVWLARIWYQYERQMDTMAARLEQLIQQEVPADCDRQQADAWLRSEE